jgi:hypothetical protein
MSEAPINHQGAKDYELIVKSIYEQILARDGVTNIEIKHNQSLTGKSGVAHQIDVMWRFKQAGVEHVVVVECKNYSSTVELGDVRSFKSVLEDLGVARGVMVTKVGFQSGAKDFAKFNGIDLKLARSPEDADWEGLIRDIDIRISAKSFDRTKPPSVKINVPKNQASVVVGTTLAGNPLELCLLNNNGEANSPPMAKFLEQNVPILEKDAGGPYSHEIKTPGQFVRLQTSEGKGILVPVDSLTITYHVSEYKTEVSVHADDLVTEVLKDFGTGDVEHFLRSAPKNIPRR